MTLRPDPHHGRAGEWQDHPGGQAGRADRACRSTSSTWSRASAAATARSARPRSGTPWSQPSPRPTTGSPRVSISAGPRRCWTVRMSSCGWTTSARPRRPAAWSVGSCRVPCGSSGPAAGGSGSCAWVTTCDTPGIWAVPCGAHGPRTTRHGFASALAAWSDRLVHCRTAADVETFVRSLAPAGASRRRWPPVGPARSRPHEHARVPALRPGSRAHARVPQRVRADGQQRPDLGAWAWSTGASAPGRIRPRSWAPAPRPSR